MFGLSLRQWALIAIVAGWVYVDFFRTPTDATAAIRNGDYSITELESFDQTVRVLAREEYRFGREADLSPMDIAVGWGVMAKPEIYRQFHITQSSRWYYWQSDSLPIPRRDVEVHSSNIHLVPATPAVADRLRRIKRDDVLALSGALIEVTAPDGWRWRSSLSREDTGQGACELLLLKQLDWVRATAGALP
jgi:hypothetical protein